MLSDINNKNDNIYKSTAQEWDDQTNNDKYKVAAIITRYHIKINIQNVKRQQV